jgi:hypothetical protein
VFSGGWRRFALCRVCDPAQRDVSVCAHVNLHLCVTRLLARGKTKMQALVAVMRKLLHAIFGMFRHRQTFDSSKVYACAPSACPVPSVQEVP